MGTTSACCSREVRRASWMAVMALSSVKSGPPKAPACWPVTTATVSGLASLLSGLARGWRSAAPSLLGGKDAGDGRVRSSHRARPGDRVGPRLSRRRIAGVERRDLGEIERVVARPAAGSSRNGARRSLCGSSRRRTSFPLTPPRTLSEPRKTCQDDHYDRSTHLARLRGFNRSGRMITVSTGRGSRTGFHGDADHADFHGTRITRIARIRGCQMRDRWPGEPAVWQACRSDVISTGCSHARVASEVP